MKKDKIKKSIKMIKKYLLSLIDKLSENEFRSNKERKIDNAFFLIEFLTSSLNIELVYIILAGITRLSHD